MVGTVVDIEFASWCCQALDALDLFKSFGIVNHDFTRWIAGVLTIPD